MIIIHTIYNKLTREKYLPILNNYYSNNNYYYNYNYYNYYNNMTHV